MSSIKVSVIIPIYNVELYLSDSVQSVCSQSYTNLEIILIDDGSPDNCGAICDEFAKQDSRICVIHQKNKGLSAARNAGLNIATGDYVLFFDSDDRLFQNSIKTLVDLANKYPGVDIVQGNSKFQDGRTRLTKVCLTEPEYIDNTQRVRNGLISRDYPSMAWNKLVRTALLKDNHIEFLEGIIHEDEMFRWSLHTCANSICFTKEQTYWYRNDNVSSIMNESDKTKSWCSKIVIASNVYNSLRTRKEYGFALRYISYKNKIRAWSQCKNPELVIQEIEKFQKKKNVPYLLKAELILWHLPIQLLANKCFMFPYRVFKGIYLRSIKK